MGKWLDQLIWDFASRMPLDSPFSLPGFVNGIIIVILVGLVCGSVGGLVVGNRMAFFSDALAHCAFAGVAFALLIALGIGARGREFMDWIVVIMIVFGVIVGMLIAYVRERTLLANDTVIGVFFAGAIGLGAMMNRAVQGRGFFTLEQFIFGSPLTTTGGDIVAMFALVAVTVLFLFVFYNKLVFTSFNESLARSRQISTRLCQYAFIALLGVIINLCLWTVGALLVNALLIVPAAAASNISRNMRQLFWLSIGLCITAGLSGIWASWELNARASLDVGPGGTIVVVSVLIFALTLLLGPIFGRRVIAPVILPSTKA